ncbi:glycosyltransferase involved in cell wall biosynthesis [Paenibacillus shirakamiensis]|uniref:Glycosyltransferase involved in cell wall biosynthesis n=1 Tax=Paenibacillus shirakamiensis TaxID=1265935 RepID=A0ABS4JKC3_9BACL|nr:glycosyltransferase [Paenibacillus shirakamiensis]MBP2002143.1 glycosyltransferase involved in cell wall biosynthesis [Paenibacillus shirakamiensis]
MSVFPKVSVIIPFYNCKYVNQAIESVLQQTYPHVEIIVVDDGSTSNQELIEPYKHRIRYLYKPNGGTASALNYGIAHATGQYFAWLSSDDRFLPNKLEQQLGFMYKKGAAASFTAYYYIDDTGSRTGEVHNIFKTRQEFYEVLLKGCPINGCSVMLHMNVFKQVGVFDEERLYTHDYDLWVRVLEIYTFEYLDELLLEYRVHGTMGTLTHWDEIMQDMQVIQQKHGNILNRLILKEGESP